MNHVNQIKALVTKHEDLLQNFMLGANMSHGDLEKALNQYKEFPNVSSKTTGYVAESGQYKQIISGVLGLRTTS